MERRVRALLFAADRPRLGDAARHPAAPRHDLCDPNVRLPRILDSAPDVGLGTAVSADKRPRCFLARPLRRAPFSYEGARTMTATHAHGARAVDRKSREAPSALPVPLDDPANDAAQPTGCCWKGRSRGSSPPAIEESAA